MRVKVSDLRKVIRQELMEKATVDPSFWQRMKGKFQKDKKGEWPSPPDLKSIKMYRDKLKELRNQLSFAKDEFFAAKEHGDKNQMQRSKDRYNRLAKGIRFYEKKLAGTKGSFTHNESVQRCEMCGHTIPCPEKDTCACRECERATVDNKKE